MPLKKYFSGPDIDKIFKKACNSGDIKDIEQALAKGADINAKLFEGDASALIRFGRDANGTTILKCLIKHKADLDQVDGWGDTALHEAAARNHFQNVDCLLKAGADITKKNHDHETALDRAKKEGHLNIIQLLERARHHRNSYKGFVKENDHTVSMIENLDFSGINLKKAFNFATQEVTTIGDNCIDLQQFSEITNQKRLDEAADALKALGGNTADWKPRKPGALATKPRHK